MDVHLVLFGILLILFSLPSFSGQCECDGSNYPPRCGEIPDRIKGSGTECYHTYKNDVGCALVTCVDNTSFSVICSKEQHGPDYFWPNSSSKCVDASTQQTTTASPSQSAHDSNATSYTTTSATDYTTITTTTAAAIVTDTTINTTTTTTYAAVDTDTTSVTTSNTASINSSSDPMTGKTPGTSSKENTQTNAQPSKTTTVVSSHAGTVVYGEVKGTDGDIAVIVSVPVCIVVVIIIVIIVVFMWRRKARRKRANSVKEQSHRAMNNNSYQDSTSNDNIIPMNMLASTAIDNGYIDMFDDKPTPEDTFDSNYNTINPPDETTNTYGSLKPGTEPFVDNTYSHMNNACVDMGAMYSHIGKSAAPQQTRQPQPINDNTYSHIGTKSTNAKTKPKTVDSGDTYSHIGKQTGVPNVKPKSVESDIMYSHIGKVVKPHHKPTDADCDATYNSLGVRPKVCLQNKQMMQYAETEDDPEYNHLTSSIQSSSTNKTSTCPSYRQYTPPPGSNTAQGSPMYNQYDEVVEADTDKPRIGNYETVNDDNETSKHSFYVLDENEDNTAKSNTDGDQTNHQYFILEKHEKEG